MGSGSGSGIGSGWKDGSLSSFGKMIPPLINDTIFKLIIRIIWFFDEYLAF
jgi:hypothetical protein